MEKFIRKPNHPCIMCQKIVYRRPSSVEKAKGKVFCSLTCNGMYQRKHRECLVCQKIFPFNSKRKKLCSRACANKSRAGIKYRAKGRGRKNKYEVYKRRKEDLASERGGFCEECGNKNFLILQIHHIKEKRDGGGEEPENLSLLCPNCHYTHHRGVMTYIEYLEKQSDRRRSSI